MGSDQRRMLTLFFWDDVEQRLYVKAPAGHEAVLFPLLTTDPDPPASGVTAYSLVVGGKVQARLLFPTGDPQILGEES